METGKIYGSLAAIMNEVQAIGKNKKNTQQGFSYRGIDDVMNELHGLFAKNGVVIVPQVLEVSKTDKQSAQEAAFFMFLPKTA